MLRSQLLKLRAGFGAAEAEKIAWTLGKNRKFFALKRAGFSDLPLVSELALSRIIERYQPARCVIFNGRMALFRIAMELAWRRGIPVPTHERGGIDDSFMFYENADCLATQHREWSVHVDVVHQSAKWTTSDAAFYQFEILYRWN